MSIPRWLVFIVAFWVMSFGAYRLLLAVRRHREGPDGPSAQRRGLYGRSPRAHAMYGVLYLLLGSYIIAMGFGYGFTAQGGCQHPGDRDQSLPAR
jgi:hypothetical protein